MRETITRTLTVSFVAILLCAMAMITPSFGQEDTLIRQSMGNDRIIDVWLTQVTPRNCLTGESVAPPFNSMLTLNQGGTMAEYGANPNTPYRSPGHGLWTRERGRNNYSMAFTFFPLNPAGIPIGRIRVEQDVHLGNGPNEMESYGGFVLRDFDGNVLATGCTTATGRRFN